MEEYDLLESAAETGLLDLAHQGWRSLDNEKHLWETPNIKILHVQFNYLQALPSDIGRLDMLRELDCSNNALEELPHALGLLKRLHTLRCDHNQLESLPPVLARCSFLEEVYAHDNRIAAVPAELGSLKELRVLQLYNNKITALPAELGGIPTLEEIDCSGNEKLEMIPTELRGDRLLIKFICKMHLDHRTEIETLMTQNTSRERSARTAEVSMLRIRDEIEGIKKDCDRINADVKKSGACVVS